MKKYIILAAFVFASFVAVSQAEDVMKVKMKDCTIHTFKVEEVDEMIFQTEENTENPEMSLSCPDGNHPHVIDLGLPSGTKWACCNIGANSPEGYGGYYAWGETESKNDYKWSNYTHYDGTKDTWHHIGDDIAGTPYDVAHVKWGGSWRMPSFDQISELINHCSTKWIKQNGVNGILVTGRNGATIFLPYAGCRLDTNLWEMGRCGYYSSSSPYPFDDSNTCYLLFNSDKCRGDICSYPRYGGISVRAVCP